MSRANLKGDTCSLSHVNVCVFWSFWRCEIGRFANIHREGHRLIQIYVIETLGHHQVLIR